MKYLLIFSLLSMLIPQFYCITKLLISNRKDVRLINFQQEKLLEDILIKNVNGATAIDFIYEKQVYCWSDSKYQFIKCVSFNQTKNDAIESSTHVLRIIEDGVVTVDGMAVDWVTGKVYWLDSGTDKLEVAEIFQPWRKVLYWTGLDQPKSLVLVPSQGLMFWCDWGSRPTLERGGMDGNFLSRKSIVDRDLFWPNALTVDYFNQRLFWADLKTHSLFSVDFEGFNRIKIMGGLNHPFGLAYSDDTLFWSDRRTEDLHRCSIRDELKCFDEEKFTLKLPPTSIHAYNLAHQSKIDSPCLHSNGGCSHLCLLAPSTHLGFICSCPTGISLINESTCRESPEEMLLLARRSDIRRISLDTPDRTPVVLPLNDVHHAIAVDFDPIGEYIYWTDDESSTIQRAHLNGSNEEIVVKSSSGLDSDGIAVDWLARNLYWTDANHNWIEVSKVDGSSRKILLRGRLDQPRAIAVFPEGGLMFWTDWGNQSKIERAYLDGSNRVRIIGKNLGWPNGIAVDYLEHKLYWVDAKTQMIEMSDFDGARRRPILTENLSHVFGFSLLGNFLYWTDWQKRSVERIRKNNGTWREVLVEQLPDVMGLKAFSVDGLRNGYSPCMEANGGCSHLCFNRPKGEHVCDCPLGYELASNAMTCVVPSAFMICVQSENFLRVSLSTFSTSTLPVGDIKQANALDYDDSGRIYWADLHSRSIKRSYLNGSGSDVIVDIGLQYPQAVTVDRVANLIYWCDIAENRIDVSRLDGKYRRTILWNLVSPRSLVVLPSEGYLFWIDGTNDATIMRSHLDGSAPVAVMQEDIATPISLTVDVKRKRLLWFDEQRSSLFSSSLDGLNTRVVQKISRPPTAIAAHDGFVFWYDSETKSLKMASNLSSSTSVWKSSVIVSDMKQVLDLVVLDNTAGGIDSSNLGNRIRNPCLRKNSGCSHLCFYDPFRPQRFVCSCPNHLSLKSDGLTCAPPLSFLIVSQKLQLNRLSGASFVSNSEPLFTPLNVPTSQNIQAVDFDRVSGFVYWIELRSREIRKARLDGSEASSLVRLQDSSAPFDLVVHSQSGLVLWSCFGNDVINATKTDGTAVGVLFSMEKLVKPRALALVSHLDLLFFINDATPPSINCLDLAASAGLHHRVVIDNGLVAPSSLAVDSGTGTLYWVDFDSSTAVIRSSDFDGGNRRVLIDGELHHPKSIAVLLNHVYWLDSEAKAIERANKFSGQEREVVVAGVNYITDIAAVYQWSHKRSSNHSCLTEGRKCSHLCIGSRSGRAHFAFSSSYHSSLVSFVDDSLSPSSGFHSFESSSFRCQCPIDMSLSADGFSCVPKPICLPNQFTCSSNHNCIPLHWRCDGIKECSDGSDEVGCSSHLCHPALFKCADGKCIDTSLVCNGAVQCSDRSDEIGCCPAGETLCLSTGLCSPCPPGVYCPEATAHCPFPVTHSVGSGSGFRENSDESGLRKRGVGASYVIGIMASVLVIVGVGAAAFYYRRRPTILDEDSCSGGTRLEALKDHSRPPAQHSLSSKGKLYVGVSTDPSWRALSPSAVMGSRVGGARVTSSSSSSSMTHYPRETLNPPPTPVALTWGGGGGGDCHRCCYAVQAAPLTHDSYRHYKARNRPPPPTPCSTDVFDDSDFCSTPSALMAHSPPPPPTPSSLCEESDLLQLTTPPSCESDPLPPPPTPLTSYPPSPATDRSYLVNAPCSTPISTCFSSD